MTRPPLAPLLLGAAGLIPFLWGALTHLGTGLATWSANQLGPRFTGQTLLEDYGIVILAFMSGVIWGFATRATARVAAVGYAASVMPALWAFFLGSGAPPQTLIALAAGFAALLALDLTFARAGLAPDWWMTLRTGLTTGVVSCLVIGALA